MSDLLRRLADAGALDALQELAEALAPGATSERTLEELTAELKALRSEPPTAEPSAPQPEDASEPAATDDDGPAGPPGGGGVEVIGEAHSANNTPTDKNAAGKSPKGVESDGMPDLRERSVAERLIGVALEAAGEGHVRPDVEYQERPLDWMVEVLEVERETIHWSLNEGYGDHEWDGTPDPLVKILDALVEWKDVGAEAGTGTGKTFLAACIALWWLACWENSIVVTIAPKKDQLLLHVWKEVDRLWPKFQKRFPGAEKLTGKVRMQKNSEVWAATAFVAGVAEQEEVATKAQGWHAPDMLLITEETPGIKLPIMKALENTRTAPHNLQLSLGNPDHREDPLHKFCEREDVVDVRISALDFPNVVCDDPTIVPGAVSRKAVVRRKILYQNTPALYDSRVRGVSPKQAFGVALGFKPDMHLESMSEEAIQHAVRTQRWPVWAAVDTGDWRTSLVVALVDRSGRLHVVREQFWHRASSAEIAEGIHGTLVEVGAESATIVADQRSAHTVKELNKALRQLGSPYSVAAVAQEAKARAASVRRLNDLLAGKKLLFRRDLGHRMKWRKGLATNNQGEPMTGSRLLWEVREWRYPEPKEGEAQRQDPDDDTADGADAIAALRYLVMTWWRQARYDVPDPEPEIDYDHHFHELMEHLDRVHKAREAGRRIRRR